MSSIRVIYPDITTREHRAAQVAQICHGTVTEHVLNGHLHRELGVMLTDTFDGITVYVDIDYKTLKTIHEQCPPCSQEATRRRANHLILFDKDSTEPTRLTCAQIAALLRKKTS